MLVSCKTLFYRKVETKTLQDYPNGSDHFYIHHFKSKMAVMGSSGKMITAPPDSLYITPPHVPKCNKGIGDEFTHSLAIFDADESFMNKLDLPYFIPFTLRDMESIDKLFLDMNYKQLMNHPLSNESRSICLASLLMTIYEQLHSEEYPPIYGNSGEAIEMTRLAVLASSGICWDSKMMASRANMSVSQYYTLYKKLFKKTPMEELYEYRYNKAKRLLSTGYNIPYVMMSCGFKSIQHFSSFFKKHSGLSPTEFIKKYKNTEYQQ